VRFGELNTLLLDYRDVTSAAKQEEYSNALNRVTEAGEATYHAAMQIITSISNDVRGGLPDSV